MLVILRIVFGLCMIYVVRQAWDNGRGNLEAGDLMNAYWTAIGVITAIANAVVWAPYIGDKIAGPITGTITKSTYVERHNYLLRLIYWTQDRGFRRLTAWLCFLEGIHHPIRPTAFVIGMQNARPGSWLEKVYAKEVFKFDNAQHCIQASQVLERHGLDPGRHHNVEVNLVLLSLEHEVKPEPARVRAAPAPPPPALKRNKQIRLFEKREAKPAAPAPAGES